MGIAAGEPIRRENINPLDLSGRDRIPQALQSRTDQDGAAIALIHVGILRREGLFVGSNALVQGGDLAGDGVIPGLLFGGDPRVKGNAAIRHAYLPEFGSCGREFGIGGVRRLSGWLWFGWVRRGGRPRSGIRG
jgi:hypothetical protein